MGITFPTEAQASRQRKEREKRQTDDADAVKKQAAQEFVVDEVRPGAIAKALGKAARRDLKI